MEQKYGKVYVQERETSTKGKDNVVLKLLVGVQFGNTDHKLYDRDGNLSPFYKRFKGRQICVQRNIHQKDKNGSDVDFLAKFALPIKLGELPPQDFEGCAKANQEKIELWKSLGILSRDAAIDEEYHRMLLRDRPTEGTALFGAGYKVSDMKLLCTALDPLFVLDDFIEGSNSKKYMPHKTSQPFWSALMEVLDGNISEDNVEELQNILKKLPTQCQVWFPGFFALRKLLVRKEQLAENVIHAFREFYGAISFENCSEWNEKQGELASTTYKLMQGELRSICYGGNITLEMVLFDQNIRLDNKLRESFLFKLLKKAYCDQIYLVNDIVSLKKEMEMGSTFNTVYQLHDKEGLTLEESLQKTIEKIAALNLLADDVGKLFTTLFAEYPEATKFVHTIKCAMYGNIQYGTITTRYDPGMVFDCVIEL